jgi:hypothetical protein
LLIFQGEKGDQEPAIEMRLDAQEDLAQKLAGEEGFSPLMAL